MEILLLAFIIALLILHQKQAAANRKLQEELRDELRAVRAEVRGLRPPKPPAAEAAAKDAAVPDAPPPVPPAPERVWRPAPLPERKQVPPPVFQPMQVVDRESWWNRWLRNNPDLEKFIGENLINKIGIAILVLGIAFFVKYAIDREWIGEAGRVAIGFLCGALLLGVGHFLRHSYRSFSSVLAGGGIAVLYTAVAFAFHQYGLLSQTVAFLFMVGVTGLAITLSLTYNRLELAVIAAAGGFITPFLLSTGQGNYHILFTYLLILNTGLLCLAWFRRWPLLNIVAFGFTEVIVAGWMTYTVQGAAAGVQYGRVFLYVTLLFCLFLGMNLIYQVRRREAFRPVDFTVLLLLNATYFAAGTVLLRQMGAEGYRGPFTAVLGALHFGLAWTFYRRAGTDRNFLYLLIGLSLTFITLAIPVQLEGHAITLFWLAEFVLLFWLYRQSRITLFYYSSLLVMAISIISLGIDWILANGEWTGLFVLFTDLRGLMANLVAIAAFALYWKFLRAEGAPLPGRLKKEDLVISALLAAGGLSFVTAVTGVNRLLGPEGSYEVANVYHRLITQAAIVAVIAVHRRRTFSSLRLPAALVLGYLFLHLLSVPVIFSLITGWLQGTYSGVHAAVHMGTVLFAFGLVYLAVRSLQRGTPSLFTDGRLAWAYCALGVAVLSTEARNAYLAIGSNGRNVEHLDAEFGYAPLTIVWALASFIIMWIGMGRQVRTLRIASLTLFCLALLKLFLYDLSRVSEGGKIAAFLLLGVLLLTVSFMYQRLRKIFMEGVGE